MHILPQNTPIIPKIHPYFPKYSYFLQKKENILPKIQLFMKYLPRNVLVTGGGLTRRRGGGYDNLCIQKKIVIFQKKFNHSTKMCNHFSKNYNHFPKKCNHPSNKFNQSSNTPTLKRIAPSLLKMYTHKKNNPILLKNILNLQKEICLSKKCLLSYCAYFFKWSCR